MCFGYNVSECQISLDFWILEFSFRHNVITFSGQREAIAGKTQFTCSRDFLARESVQLKRAQHLGSSMGNYQNISEFLQRIVVRFEGSIFSTSATPCTDGEAARTLVLHCRWLNMKSSTVLLIVLPMLTLLGAVVESSTCSQNGLYTCVQEREADCQRCYSGTARLRCENFLFAMFDYFRHLVRKYFLRTSLQNLQKSSLSSKSLYCEGFVRLFVRVDAPLDIGERPNIDAAGGAALLESALESRTSDVDFTISSDVIYESVVQPVPSPLTSSSTNGQLVSPGVPQPSLEVSIYPSASVVPTPPASDETSPSPTISTHPSMQHVSSQSIPSSSSTFQYSPSSSTLAAPLPKPTNSYPRSYPVPNWYPKPYSGGHTTWPRFRFYGNIPRKVRRLVGHSRLPVNARQVIRSNKPVRRSIIRAVVKDLVERRGWGDVFTVNMMHIKIYKKAANLYVLIIPFTKKYSVEVAL